MQAVKRHVRKSRRYDTSLGSTLFGGKELFVEYKTAFKPFPEHHFIHRDIVEQPFMADVVEASFNVALQNPLRR